MIRSAFPSACPARPFELRLRRPDENKIPFVIARTQYMVLSGVLTPLEKPALVASVPKELANQIPHVCVCVCVRIARFFLVVWKRREGCVINDNRRRRQAFFSLSLCFPALACKERQLLQRVLSLSQSPPNKPRDVSCSRF